MDGQNNMTPETMVADKKNGQNGGKLTKKRVLIGVLALIVLAAVVVTIILLTKDKPYNYDLSKYIKVGDYKGLEIEKAAKVTVTDKEVNAKIKETLTGAATTKEKKKGKVVKGNTVNIDYEGKVNGKTFDGGSATGSSLEIGSGSMIDGFESGLIGAKVGETKKLKLKFPSDYSQNSDLAGKNVVFTVKVNSIAVSITPTLTAYVKDNTDYKTVKEYKDSVEKSLKKEKEDAQLSEQKNTLWNTVVESSKVKKYPEKELNAAKETVKNQMKSYASSMGTDVKALRKQMGMTKDADYNAYIKQQAESTVKNEMVVYYIADKEKIELDVDPAEELEKLIEKAGFTEDTFKSQYNMSISDYIDENKDSYQLSLLTEKVLDFIYDNAKQVDKKSNK